MFFFFQLFYKQKKLIFHTIILIQIHVIRHPIAILGDLQGPKLRVGEFSDANGVYLDAGQTFRLDLDEAKGDKTRVMVRTINVTHAPVYAMVSFSFSNPFYIYI